MQFKRIFKISGLALLLMLQLSSRAQIYSSESDFIDTTEYINDDLGKHPIFVYTTQRGDYPDSVKLLTKLPGHDTLTFRWIAYDYALFGFTDTLLIEDSLAESQYVSNEPGGFKVDVYNSNIDTTFYCWVNISDFQISNIAIYESNCNYMELRTTLNFDDQYLYYDLIDATALYQLHSYEVEQWEVSPDGIYDGGSLNPSFSAPVEYARFTLTLSDNFGQVRTNYVDIEEEEIESGEVILMATEADFTPTRAYTPSDETNKTGQAPLVLQFDNDSKNGVDFEWTFYNDRHYCSIGGDSVLVESSFFEPFDSIRYEQIPSTSEDPHQKAYYDVRLISYGPVYEINGQEGQCKSIKSTLDSAEYIVVDSVEIPEFANVFTPPSDGVNDYFHFEGGKASGFNGARSVKSFSIKIYSRWGDKVYDYDGDINEWPGWDGTTAGNIIAKTGIYYYSAFIQGWDDLGHNKKGFVYLFRDDK